MATHYDELKVKLHLEDSFILTENTEFLKHIQKEAIKREKIKGIIIKKPIDITSLDPQDEHIKILIDGKIVSIKRDTAMLKQIIIRLLNKQIKEIIE